MAHQFEYNWDIAPRLSRDGCLVLEWHADVSRAPGDAAACSVSRAPGDAAACSVSGAPGDAAACSVDGAARASAFWAHFLKRGKTQRRRRFPTWRYADGYANGVSVRKN